MSEHDQKETTPSAGRRMKPWMGMGLAYLFASLVAGFIISLGVIISDIPDEGWPSLGNALGFLLTGLIFTTVLAMIAFVPLRYVLYKFRYSSSMSFILAGAVEGGVVGYVFIQGFDLAWLLILAGAAAGAVQWKLEKRFVGEITVIKRAAAGDE